MRRTVLLAAMASSGLLTAAVAAAQPSASAAHACLSFTEITHRNYSGQHHSFKIRVHNITTRGIHCGGTDYVIRQFDKQLAPGPGIYTGVGPWQCRAFRPIDLNNKPAWYNDCKRGGKWIKWIETQLSRS